MSTVAAAREHSGELTAQRDAPLGGQAVMEGVMMRGVGNWAVGVRKPAPGLAGRLPSDEGEIEVKTFPLDSAMARHRVLRLPIIRGVVALGSSLAIGFKALEISANAQLIEPGRLRRQLADGAATPTAPLPTARRRRTARRANGASRPPRRGTAPAGEEIPRAVWLGHDRGRAGAGDRAVLRGPRRDHQPDQEPARLPGPVLAGRGVHPHRPVPRLHVHALAGQRPAAGVRVPRRGAQDDLLLRGRAAADARRTPSASPGFTPAAGRASCWL